MREIKFRALVQYPGLEKMWVYYEPLTIPHAFYDQNNEDQAKVAIIHAKNLEFTGLTDKNGVEVYEGDVLEVKFAHGTKRSVVQFWPEYGIYALAEVPNYYVESAKNRPMGSSGSSTGYKPYTWKTYRSTEVIGNIYENPELIAQ